MIRTKDYQVWTTEALETDSEVMKVFSCLTEPSMKFSLLINMKIPKIVGIFIFISREIFMHSYI